MAVERFRGEFFPFSNMYTMPNWIEADCGVLVPTSEHAYMANRFLDMQLQLAIAAARGLPEETEIYKDGNAAKKLAHEFITAGAELVVKDDIARVGLMKRVVLAKVEANDEVRELLLKTGEVKIEEGNAWEDTFWGISPPGSGNGQNHLGKILMQIRKEIA